jgi:hypothetical protein
MFQDVPLNDASESFRVEHEPIQGEPPIRGARAIPIDPPGEEMMIDQTTFAIRDGVPVNIDGFQPIQQQGAWWNPVTILVGLVPVKNIVGRDMDNLTETGVAHTLTIFGLLALFLVLLAFFLRSYWYNRSGYRGQIRRLANAYHTGNGHSANRGAQGKRKFLKEETSGGDTPLGWFSRWWPGRLARGKTTGGGSDGGDDDDEREQRKQKQRKKEKLKKLY